MAGDLLTAADVARGVCRLFAQAGLVAIPEVPLPNGRRTDLTAIDAKGQITIVEIKVSRADLHGDGKWPDYCDWFDRFYWRSEEDTSELPALMRISYSVFYLK